MVSISRNHCHHPPKPRHRLKLHRPHSYNTRAQSYSIGPSPIRFLRHGARSLRSVPCDCCADLSPAPRAACLSSLSPAPRRPLLARRPITTAAPRRIRPFVRVAALAATAPPHASVGAGWGNGRAFGCHLALPTRIAPPTLALPACLGGVEGVGSAEVGESI